MRDLQQGSRMRARGWTPCQDNGEGGCGMGGHNDSSSSERKNQPATDHSKLLWVLCKTADTDPFSRFAFTVVFRLYGEVDQAHKFGRI